MVDMGHNSFTWECMGWGIENHEIMDYGVRLDLTSGSIV